MVDDRSKAEKPDPDRIDVNKPSELSNWAKQLGVTETKLREAVSQVGPTLAAVKKYVGK